MEVITASRSVKEEKRGSRDGGFAKLSATN